MGGYSGGRYLSTECASLSGAGPRSPTIVLALLILCAHLLNMACAFPSYQSSIPNGDLVTRNGVAWPGVGHLAAGGGGSRNAFGVAFQAEGRQWTKALCEQDSDGDGQSNGLELGDPNCVWKVGALPARVADISHPGFIDSTTSAIGAVPTQPTPAPTSESTAAPTPCTTGSPSSGYSGGRYLRTECVTLSSAWSRRPVMLAVFIWMVLVQW